MQVVIRTKACVEYSGRRAVQPAWKPYLLMFVIAHGSSSIILRANGLTRTGCDPSTVNLCGLLQSLDPCESGTFGLRLLSCILVTHLMEYSWGARMSIPG